MKKSAMTSLGALDALRWGKADLFRLVPDGEKRLQAVIALWGCSPRLDLQKGIQQQRNMNW